MYVGLSEVLRTMSADVCDKRIININSVRNKIDYVGNLLGESIEKELDLFLKEL